jgi:hypothetical protein
VWERISGMTFSRVDRPARSSAALKLASIMPHLRDTSGRKHAPECRWPRS